MSRVEEKCDHCGGTAQVFLECDGCGKREPHPYCNVFPANWYYIRVAKRTPEHEGETTAQDYRQDDLLEGDACSVACRDKILVSAPGEIGVK